MVACVAIFGGILFSQKKSNPSSSVTAEPSTHIYGVDPSQAPDPELVVNLTEYGDFECPGCFSYYPIFKQLKEQYKDQITFQFRNFPLTQIHPVAMAAHRAAEAASNQGKFWEMHDIIYERQKSWTGTNTAAQTFRGYAEELNLDMEQYDADVISEKTNAVIQADIKAGQDLRVNSTPTFVLDGQVIELPTSYEQFEQIIKDAIAKKSTT